MDGVNCAHVQQFLREATAPSAPVVPAALREHLRTCPACQAALLLITALDLPGLPATIECAQCQQELAAYIDLEQHEGPERAARRYPNTWWHLWTCAECLETYEVTLALVDATQRGVLALPRLSLPAPPGRLVHLLRLTRQFLAIALPLPQPAVARGGEDEAQIISEGDSPDGARYMLSVTAEHQGTWLITVTLLPALHGTLVLTLGGLIMRTAFDAAGQAVISGVPAALLLDPEGPDLEVDLVLDGDPPDYWSPIEEHRQ